MKDLLKIFKWFERNMFKLIFILIGVIIIYGIVMFLMPIFQFVGFIGDGFNEVQNIIKYRCGTCHAKNPTFEGIEVAPKGVIYDTASDIIKNIKLIKAQAVDSEIMPPNNLTGITNQERETLRIWIEQGANTNN